MSLKKFLRRHYRANRTELMSIKLGNFKMFYIAGMQMYGGTEFNGRQTYDDWISCFAAYNRAVREEGRNA